jgi:hypothetical protein
MIALFFGINLSQDENRKNSSRKIYLLFISLLQFGRISWCFLGLADYFHSLADNLLVSA